MEEAFNDIEIFASNLSAIDLIEKLEENESVIDHSKLFSFVQAIICILSSVSIDKNISDVLFIQDHLGKHGSHNDNIPNTHSNHLFPDGWGHYLSVWFDWRSLCNSFNWWLS